MRTNARKREATILTHGGAPASKEAAEKELVRTVSCCLLWEDSYYESGSSIAKRIEELSKEVPLGFLAGLAVRARTELKLRHVPLFLCLQMLGKKDADVADVVGRLRKAKEEKDQEKVAKLRERLRESAAARNTVCETIAEVIRRPDELTEILALWWKDGRRKVPRQLKYGIAKAFRKFDEYRLAKWDRAGAVKLRDALFISHAKPKDEAQAALWKRLVEGDLATPETWEVLCSKGMPKKDVFTKLITEDKLGYMALLANLRNCEESGVDRAIVEKALLDGAEGSWALPYRFLTAAKYAPQLEPALDKAMVKAASALPKMAGRTLLVVDLSGSMGGRLGGKTEMTRVDAACALSILLREQAEDITVYATAGDDTARRHATAHVPPRHGFGLADAIRSKSPEIGGGGIFLKQCLDFIDGQEKGAKFDRVIAITDEQDCDTKVAASEAKKLGRFNYILNLGVYEPAMPVAGSGWIRVSGFAERVADWMMAEEKVPTIVDQGTLG